MGDSEFVKLSVGDVFHRRYRIDRLIKEGGFGAVYDVFDQNTEGRRALKVMLQNAFEDPELYERFMREVKIAGSIESDHIVRVYDAGTDDDTRMPFMVMELLQGEELAVLAKRQAKLQRPLPWAEILDYLGQTARALDKVHSHPKRIVHRDLKPQNLFVTRRETGEVCIKVLDFGIAKIDTADKTNTRGLGTPKYMAPEQFLGQNRRIGPATDIYALALIAYTLLAGEPYWTEEEKAADLPLLLYVNIMGGIVEPPVARALRRSNIELPPAFDAWFLKAAAKEPEDRFTKATESIAALAEVLSIPQRRSMQSEISIEPLPPPPLSVTSADPSAPTRPEKLPVRGVPVPFAPDSDPVQASQSGDHSTKPTGDTKRGVTKDPSVQVPVRSWGPAIAGGVAFAGALIVAGVIWKIVTQQSIEPPQPTGVAQTMTATAALVSATSAPTQAATAPPTSTPAQVAPPPPIADAGAQPPVVNAGARTVPPKDGGKLTPKDVKSANTAAATTPSTTATVAAPTATTPPKKRDLDITAVDQP